jgi:ABC-type transport system involved in cytochrome c biogenesis permease subunit
MKLIRLSFLFFFYLSIFQQTALLSSEDFPVLYQGRYRPAEAYGRLWFYQIAHRQTLNRELSDAIGAQQRSPLNLLWLFEFSGSATTENEPLFWIGSLELKRFLHLPLDQRRFSYHTLQPFMLSEDPIKKMGVEEEWSRLAALVKEFETLQNQSRYEKRAHQLQLEGLSPKEIGSRLESEFPLMQRIRTASPLFRALPNRFQSGDWLPLKALDLKVYNPDTQHLDMIGNFTLYPDNLFRSLQEAYQEAKKSAKASPRHLPASESIKKLSDQLMAAYSQLAGSPVREANGKSLHYPSINQLRAEALYVGYPWIPSLLFLYALALFLLAASLRIPVIHKAAYFAVGAALLLHTLILATRCYILQRPPVSNMFETVIYVPWIACLASLLIRSFRRQTFALIAACATSFFLLAISETAGLSQTLDPVQAVLDSQFWLMVHVLLVVGSYGLFILGGILGHFYLGRFWISKAEASTQTVLSQLILQSLYAGTALLISGTILGGVWAAESWGRFWDWDPKESWAFISSCYYLLWIHAYRFHRIHSFGLAIGAVSGLMAISFTWYGVNYILGTGLHSYGFGSGGEGWYYAYLAGELMFLAISVLFYLRRSSKKLV